jgi:poly(ADP-ribose) glycohydrolase ARH3
MTVDLHSKFLGAMIGSAIGDAVGELASGQTNRKDLVDHIGAATELRYTESTVLSLATASMLIERETIDAQLLGHIFKEHFRNEPWRGYSEGPRQIFARVEETGVGYLDAARQLYDGQGSWGCGAAARILPIALYHHQSPDDVIYREAEKAAVITHSHPLGIDGAAVLARAEVKALHFNFSRPFSPQAIINVLAGFSRVDELRDKLQLIPTLLNSEASPAEAAESCGLGPGAHESLSFALYSFLRNPHTFMECVLCAVLQGGVRSILGATAGAMAGGYLGIEAIPVDWQNKLENRQHIESLARELAARSINLSGSSSD